MNKYYASLIIVVSLFFIAAPVGAASELESLGAAIYQDLNLSINQNQSCQTCHHPSAGFADPKNRISPNIFPVSEGSIPGLFGGRNAPEASYAGFSPIFHYDGELFVGGVFWDGRATGRMDITATGGLGFGPTGDPMADQAKGPFGNPIEMALTSANTGVSTEASVVGIIQTSNYADKFEAVFGPNAFADVGVAYNNASLAIAAFERSKNVNKFSSKFDAFIKEQGGDISNFGVVVDKKTGFRKYSGPPAGFKSKVFTYDEADGLAIFNADSYTQGGGTPPQGQSNGGMCYLCHLTTNHEVVDDGWLPANGPAVGIYNPVLTDFTFDNLGLPKNPRIAELAGEQPADLGIGGQVAQLKAANRKCKPEKEIGKFKVSSLRNLPRTAPYGHNGYFATIYDVVHFYNTRDVLPKCDGSGTIGIDCWPAPEVPETVNDGELGNLGLKLEQERKIVLFLETLND